MTETLIKKIKEIFQNKSLIEQPSKFWFFDKTVIGAVLIIVLILIAILIGKFYQPNTGEFNQLNNEYLEGIRESYADCISFKTETGVRKFTENYCRDIMKKSLKEIGY